MTDVRTQPGTALRAPASGAPFVSRLPLTCVVIAQNCGSILPRCLGSLSFADDVLVIDGGSHDDTVAVATALGARVIVNRWPGFAEQRRFALRHARHDWVFSCDSDEEVTPALAAEIAATLSPTRRGAATRGFRIPRRSQFLGAWMDVGPWTRDAPLRLFEAGAARVTDTSVHEGFLVDGPVATLTSTLLHYTHTTLAESVRRLNRYTTLEARDRVSRRRIHVLDPLVSPVGVFLKYYLVKGCWRAGMRGYLLASVTAMYKMVLYVKIRELQQSGRKSR